MIDPSDSEASADPSVGGSAEHALGQLYRDHVDDARRLAYILVGGEQADELVAEAFARVLGQVRAGRGPTSDFRSYLHVTIRNIFRDSLRRSRETPMSDQPWIFDATVASPEEALDDFDERAAAAAFATLPASWQQVLWYVEIEGRKPAEVARILDMRPRAVSSLAHRAREGLRRAYLDAHLDGAPVAERCAWSHARLSQYVRGDLSERAANRVAAHLETCPDCLAAYLQLQTVNRKLAAYLFPVVLVGAVPGGGQLPAWLVGHTGLSGAAVTGASDTAAASTVSGNVLLGALVGTVALVSIGGLALVLRPADGDPAVPPVAEPARPSASPDVLVPPAVKPFPQPRPPRPRTSSVELVPMAFVPAVPDEPVRPVDPKPTTPTRPPPLPSGPAGPSVPTPPVVPVPTVVTPVAPTATPPTTCDAPGSLTLPTTRGVSYVLTAGDGQSGPWEVTATPQSGYVFAGGATSAVFSGDLVQPPCTRLVAASSSNIGLPLAGPWRTTVIPEVTGGPNRTISVVLDFRDGVLVRAGAVSGQGWRCHAPDGTTIGGLVEFALPLGSPGLPIICDVEYTGSPVDPLQFDLVSLDLLSRTPAASATLLSDGEVVDSVPIL